ncbi:MULTISPECIES: glycosyl hydrolase family 18 protein [Kitasatospora]|uniref:carbohydrate-binding protein n=2 Tax=Streptomycetaceae TaxID=2062 RepID=UPI0002ECB774|nr:MULTISPECIES: glycosyl hydrolase family 18 protein [Kitasatospora]
MSRSAPARRLLTAAVAAALPAAALAVVAAGPAHAAGGTFPAHYSAPYLEIDSSTAGDLAADLSASGDKFYTLAFLTPKSGCTPMWERGNDPVGAFKSQIGSLQSAGGNVIISFGGAAGGELAQTCTSVSSLTAAYANIVNTYGVTRLDFDIEGSVLDDTTANARRDQALAALQAQNPNVQIDFTLPVDPGGLPANAMNMLKDAKSKGVKVNLVNIMTMDFGNGQNALNDAESAANGTAPQLASLYGITTAQAFNRLGLTPIAGQNDDNEFFSQANAQTLETFAASKGVQELAFWEVDGYDKALNYAYSKIFQKITGGTTASDFSVAVSPNSGSVKAGSPATVSVSTAVTSGVAESVALSASGLPAGASASFSPASVNSGSGSTLTVTTTASTPAGTYPITVKGTAASGTHSATYTLTVTATSTGTCQPAWNPATAYVPNDQVSYNGHNYTALYWSTDVTPGSAIAWNIWQDNGTC